LSGEPVLEHVAPPASANAQRCKLIGSRLGLTLAAAMPAPP